MKKPTVEKLATVPYPVPLSITRTTFYVLSKFKDILK